MLTQGPAQDRRVHRLGDRGGHEAIADTGWKPQTDEERESTGVMIGSGIGGLSGIYEASHHAAGEGAAAHLARSSFLGR